MSEPSHMPSERVEHVRGAGTAAPALFLVVVLSGVWTWWAWKEGAYFAVVALPGTLVLCVAAGLLLAILPISGLRMSRPVAIGVGSLIGLGLWTLASALWTPAPDTAVGDAQRVLAYALSFALGLWLCHLLGRRMQLALLPIVVAAAVAGVAAVVGLLSSDIPRDLLEDDGTLEFPLGYRNANAAFFAIAIFPALGLASDAARDWRLRAIALGAATLAIDLAMLSQSRASLPVIVVAAIVFVVASPQRLRSLSWLALAALPAAAVIPALTELYGAVDDQGLRNVVEEMRGAGRMTALAAVVAIVAGAVAARLEGRVPGLSSAGGASNRVVGIGLAALAAASAIGFVITVGDPVDWANERWEEFKVTGSPDLSESSSRFTINAGSRRYRLWQVAVDAGTESPLLGEGAGGYEYFHLREREDDRDVRDAHSVEFEVFSELGFPGLLLLLTTIAGVGVGVFASRRLPQPAAGLSAVALASGTYWLLHASIDWFWVYPAVTAPTFAVLGAACAPGLIGEPRPGARRLRWAAVAGIAILAISTVPPFLSQRYVDDAYAVWQRDIGRAYDDLDRAQALNPLNDLPLLAEGAIARAAGDRTRAIEAFSEAAEKRPEGWAARYLLAEMQQDTDPAAARDQIAVALELNPHSGRARSLARRLGVMPPPWPRE